MRKFVHRVLSLTRIGPGSSEVILRAEKQAQREPSGIRLRTAGLQVAAIKDGVTMPNMMSDHELALIDAYWRARRRRGRIHWGHGRIPAMS